MKPLPASPSLVEQVRCAVLGEINSGRMPPGTRVVQEPLAQALGVSRQPVQQALLLLRDQGVLREAAGRGLEVAPLDADAVQHMYDFRGAIEAMAARRAAERSAERAARQGPAIIEAGRKAVDQTSIAKLVAADRRFHEFVYELAGNPLVGTVMALHWTYTERVMSEVLQGVEAPRNIWDQHAAILEAIAAGDPNRAEALSRAHTDKAAAFMTAPLISLAGKASAPG